MQALYAVGFDIWSAQEQPGHVYERLRDHLADWRSHGGRVPAPSVTEFDQDGRAVLAGKIPGHGDRTVSWTVAGDDLTRALRMTIHQPLSAGPAQFVTRVTVSKSEEGGGGLRIRESEPTDSGPGCHRAPALSVGGTGREESRHGS